MMAEAPSQVSFANLLHALWDVDNDEGSNQTYAAGGNIAPNRRGSVLDSVTVEGAGELRLPLSPDDRLKLLGVCEQAPFGRGLDTVVDTAVRRAWQVDASKVKLPDEFVSKTVQQIANKAVQALGLDGAGLQLEAHLYKLLLYEPGGHFSFHRDTEKEPGMLLSMVIQLPTEGGFEGGSLVVRHGGATKTFDFSKESSTGVFYTVFFADCEHELQKVTTGTRLCLTFNLVRGNNTSDMQNEQGELKGFSSRLARVKAVLQPWLDVIAAGGETCEDGHLEKLAIPLKHKYTKKNLSFSGLKGEDKIVAQVLRNCQDMLKRPWLDLHLAMLTKYQYGSTAYEGRSRYKKRRYYNSDSSEDDENQQRAMEEIHQENITFTNWVGINNKPCSFEVEFDKEHEVVIAENEELFEDGAKPDKSEYEGYTGNAGPTLAYWYYKAVIVIWPKKLLLSIARKLGHSGFLDVLECTAAEGDPDVVTMLHDMLTYWESHNSEQVSMRSYWSDTDTCRLVELSLLVGGLEGFLHALRLLSKTSEPDPGPLDAIALFQSTLDPSFLYRRAASMNRSIGILGEGTASAIARGVQVHGWNNCASHVVELLKKDVTTHCDTYSTLAFNLRALGCHDAALMVAKRTLEVGMAACSFWSQLDETKLDSLVKLLFLFTELIDEFGVPFLERFEKVSVKVLHSLAVKIFPQISNEIVQEGGSTKATLFTRICELITSRDFHCELLTTSGSQHGALHSRDFYRGIRYSRDYSGSTSSPLSVVDLVSTFCSFGREQLLDKLIQALVDQSRQHNQQLLKQLLDNGAIWREFSSTSMGMNALQLLVGERVNSLAAKGEPVFSWCMPLARLPDHPIVEAFLKSPQESFTYTGSTLGGLPGARKFAQTFFNGSYQAGFSGTGVEGGRGAEAFCVIIKNRAAFQHDYNQWLKDQGEVAGLRDRLVKTQVAASTRAGGIRTEGVISSPDARVLQLHKRKRVEEDEEEDDDDDDDDEDDEEEEEDEEVEEEEEEEEEEPETINLILDDD